MCINQGLIRSRVDFHTHSCLSDGINTVDEIIQLAYEDGLAAIGIRDHNLFALTYRIQIGDGEQRMIVHPECEFSTSYFVPEWGENIEVHVIGFWEKAVNPELFSDIIGRCSQGRVDYIKAILEQLERIGIQVSLEEILEEQRKTGHLSRHMICEVIIRKGYAQTVDEAMDRFVGNWSPYYINPLKFVSYSNISEVIQRICESGGLPILCHPFGYSLSKEEIETLVRSFSEVSQGIGGIELYYERYLEDSDRMDFLRKMASEYKLFPSVASDRHRPDQPFANGGDISCYQEMLKIINNK